MKRLCLPILERWVGSLLGGFAGCMLARSRAVVAEGVVAAQDRIALAQLEWAEHKRKMAQLLVLAVVSGALVVTALLLLAVAMLAQWWDTPYRLLVVWILVAIAMLACGVALALLVSGMRRAGEAFALTRRELLNDWQALQEQLHEPLQP